MRRPLKWQKGRPMGGPTRDPSRWMTTRRKKSTLARLAVTRELGLQPGSARHGLGARALHEVVLAAEAAAAGGVLDEGLGAVDLAALLQVLVLGVDVGLGGDHVVPAAVPVELAVRVRDVGEKVVDLDLRARRDRRHGGLREGGDRG